MATLQGVYSAVVTDNRDPESLARVRVRIAGLPDATGTGDVWARLATMMAGPNRGTFFLPEVNDEVLVAFERGDARLPYVIGALWNGKARPPAGAADASAVKMIRSRSGVTLRINDDSGGNSFVVETPGGQRLTLQDGPGTVQVEDANGNSVTLSPSGVKIVAAAAITLNASRLDVNAGMVTVNAGMSRFTGVVQCDTVITNSVVSSSYTPGAGNVW